MSGYAAVRSLPVGQTPRRVSTWARYHLRRAALADLGYAVVGVPAAAELRLGDHVTMTYLWLSLAMPLLSLAALWLAGGYDVRFVGIGSDEFRKVVVVGHVRAVASVIVDCKPRGLVRRLTLGESQRGTSWDRGKCRRYLALPILGGVGALVWLCCHPWSAGRPGRETAVKVGQGLSSWGRTGRFRLCHGRSARRGGTSLR